MKEEKQKPFPYEPDPQRTVKPQRPLWLVISIVVGCLLLLVSIFWAVDTFNLTFAEKRMTGTIVEKKFTPAPAEEFTLNRRGGLQVRNVKGEFTFTVRVPEDEGNSRDFTVWVPEHIYNAYNIGDNFDVGPYLVPTNN
ncbi:MAG: hypothetical protein NZL93_05240 [Chthoniobacterales bacterium]|nr:hypothetical protein [Chthoniobacterales bacterium]